MNHELANAKKNLRSTVKSRLNTLKLDRVDAAMRLYERLVAIPNVKRAKTIGVFVDFGTEIATRCFIPDLFNGEGTTRTVGVPFCVGSEMRFFKLSRPDLDPETNAPVFHDLIPMSFGILEPKPELRQQPEKMISPDDFDVMITPGLAFDLHGRRLGRGAGFYDRYLPLLRHDAFIVGVSYEEQLVEHLPTGDYDFNIHAVVTPDRVVVFE